MTSRPISRSFAITAETEETQLIGQTRNLQRRLLALNLTRPRPGLKPPRHWLARTCEVFHEDAGTTGEIPEPEHGQYRFIIAALATSLSTVGLVRFAYTPLLPDLIRAHWFSERVLIGLSSAALVGFLAGALFGRPAAAKLGATNLLNAMNVCASLSLLACAFPVSISWFFLWRMAGGISGGVVVVLLAATVLPHVSAEKKGVVGGAIFIGFGVGILSSGTLVPLLLRYGLQTTWLGLGFLSSVLTLVAWRRWPCDPGPAISRQRKQTKSDLPEAKRLVFFLLFSCFSLGLASVMLFLSTYVARQLHSEKTASWAWLFYGLGATFGPLLMGWATSRFGGILSLRVVLAFEAVATGGLMLVMQGSEALIPALFLGMAITGIVPLAQGWLRELLPGDTDSQNRIWSTTSVVYAATQTIAGYLFAWILNKNGHDYRYVFGISAFSLLVAFVLAIATFRRPAAAAVLHLKARG